MTILYILITILAIVLIGAYFFINSAPPLPKNVDVMIQQVKSEGIPEFIKGRTEKTKNGEVTIGYEVIDSPKSNQETIVLICGHTQILLDWPDYFYQPLVDAGYRVIRFDNRSVGSSDWLPNYDKKKPYLLADMAKDIIAILDKENITKAHIIGMSMGGMIGQRLTISHASRVLSLTSIMSTGFFFDPKLTNVPKDFYRNLIAVSLKYPINSKKEATKLKLNLAIRQLQDGKGDYELDRKLVIQRGMYELNKRSGYNIKATDHHSLAIEKSGSRYDELGKISVPTLVIHGTTDPLIKFEHAQKYAPMISNATTLFIEGMGHDLPAIHTPKMIAAILVNLRKNQLINT
ncbi:MAG: alpha/beta fold hydrolase [Saprospiraceae bacterium]